MTRNVIITDGTDIVPFRVLGENITILADHSQTGSYEVYVHDAPQGAGPPPHSHPWDEAFYVVDGEVDFDCGSISKKVKAGGFVHVPAGTVHAFRYASPTARVIGVTSGEGAAAVFGAVDRECSAASNISEVAAVLRRHRVEVADQPV